MVSYVDKRIVYEIPRYLGSRLIELNPIDCNLFLDQFMLNFGWGTIRFQFSDRKAIIFERLEQ